MCAYRSHEARCFDSLQDKLLWVEDFLGQRLREEWGSGGTGSAAVVDSQTGGIVRITTGAVNGNFYFIDWNDIRSLLVTKRVSMELYVKLNDILLTHFTLSLFFDADNDIRFLFDTATSPNWYIGTEDNTVQTRLDSGVAADTSYHIFRIECHTHVSNHVHYYIDNVQTANSPITTNVPDDATDYFQPYLFAMTRENAAKSMDIDYIGIREDR